MQLVSSVRARSLVNLSAVLGAHLQTSIAAVGVVFCGAGSGTDAEARVLSLKPHLRLVFTPSIRWSTSMVATCSPPGKLRISCRAIRANSRLVPSAFAMATLGNLIQTAHGPDAPQRGRFMVIRRKKRCRVLHCCRGSKSA